MTDKFANTKHSERMRKGREALIDRVNTSIQKANVKRAVKGLPLGLNVSMRHLNRAVAIARHPGPNMDFNAGDLNNLLVAAGFMK